MVYENLYKNNTLIDMVQYNGRINIIEDHPDPLLKFKMYEQNSTNNKSVAYSDALVNVIEDTLLSKIFFSAENQHAPEISMPGSLLNHGFYTKM